MLTVVGSWHQKTQFAVEVSRTACKWYQKFRGAPISGEVLIGQYEKSSYSVCSRPGTVCSIGLNPMFLETCASMLPGLSLSSLQQLHRSLAWCVFHMPVGSTRMRKNGEYPREIPPTLRSWSGLSIFQRGVFSCIPGKEQLALGGTSKKPDQDVTSPKRSGVNGTFAQKVEYSSSTESRWSSEVWVTPIHKRKQIYCNRSLNMKSIVAVGFDMDYTLAQYKAETFETLAYTGTINKLVHNLGYPKEILDWNFDWTYMVRGLVLDKNRGNILKMDRHKYVKVAYHGFRELSREERASAYGNALSRESFDEPDYALIDTLFSLAEAYLFAQLVELKDACPGKVPSGSDYSQIYRDVRAAVDLCHRDGTLKDAVARDPGKYINDDPKIVSMLKMLQDSGRLTFLVTNSLWDYTHVVMNYLFGKCGTNGGIPRDNDWLSYFNIVITGSAKPSFFKDGNSAPMFEVDINTGMLRNTDNGSPLAQIREVSVKVETSPSGTPKRGCRVFQGGGVVHLHKLLAIEASAQVMYAGDHIYGDILRSKKALGWRTMLVVPELEKELEILQHTADSHKEVQRLRLQRDALEDNLQRLVCEYQHTDTLEGRNAVHFELQRVQIQRDRVREQHRQAQRECHHRFHRTWGQLMKTGYQNSRFAHQVERFACLYTSQVTNLCHYSPDKCYRPSEDYMPHEMDIYSV